MIAIGKIVRSIGLKGEFRIEPFGDDPKRFKKLSQVFIGPDEQGAVGYPVEHFRIGAGAVVAKCGGIDDRTAADGVKNFLIWIDEHDAVRPRKGRWFIHEIIGMAVETEEGRAVGTVTDVLQMPAHDVWAVQTPAGEALIPVIKEFIKRVDVERRTIVIHAMEGLLPE